VHFREHAFALAALAALALAPGRDRGLTFPRIRVDRVIGLHWIGQDRHWGRRARHP
jgi:hypothetical protein